jgi:hypothetical protein
MSLARMGAIAACLFALAASGCGGDIRADELSRSIDTLTSSAGEGMLLARGVAEDRTKTTFTRVRATELTEDVDHEAEKLNDATAGPGLADEKRAAVGLAEEISSQLGELEISPTDEKIAIGVDHALSRLQARAERLSGSL